MAELDKKKSYSIDMKVGTKTKLASLARQLRLPQGDALDYVLAEYDQTQDKLIEAANNKELIEVIIAQQNQLILAQQEQNALLLRLAEGMNHG